MGQEILYCVVCRTQLRGVDFEKKTAVKSGMEAYCASCLPQGVEPDPVKSESVEPGPLTPRRGVAAGGRKLSNSSTKSSTVKDGDGSPPTRRWTTPRKQSSTGMIVGGTIGGIALLVILLIAAGTSSAPRAKPKTPPPSPLPPPVVKKETPAPAPTPKRPAENLERHKAAVRALNAAIEFAEKNPEKREEIVQKYREAVKLAEGTEEYTRARTRLGEAERELQKLEDLALTALHAKLKAAFAEEKFKGLLEILKKAEGERADAAWGREVERLRTDYRARFREAYAPLRKQAQAALKAGDETRVNEIREKIASWGLNGMADELETALAKVKPEPKVDPAASRYESAWEEAMTRAGKADFEGAVAVLEKAAGELSGQKAGADLDLAVLRKALALSSEASASVSQWKKGKAVTLRYRDPQGAMRSVEGKVEEVAGGRVVLEEGPGVEIGEIAFASVLGELSGSPEDRMVAALACVAEGDGVGAKAVAGESWSKAPGKYRTWKPAPLPAAEAEARSLYYGALGKLADPMRAAEGIAALRSLEKGHAGTAFVKRNGRAIAHSGKQGREFLLTASRMTAAGSFARQKTDAVEVAWVSRSDSAEAERRANYVELKFRAIAGEPYRLWMHLAGCCAEVMGFTVQGTDLRDGRNGPEAAPGSEHEVPVRVRVFGSRRTHLKHGGPKQPEKWYWVQVPLPEYETEGEKVVRLLTNQKGFAVGYAFLTAAGSSPPRGTALEKRLTQRTTTPAARATSGLVMLYTFREGKGDVVKDVSGAEPAMDLKIEKPAAVEWLGSKGLKVKSSVKIFAASEKKLVGRCKASNELTVEAWVVPASKDQKGPARIVSFSKDSGNRWFTMGQGNNTGAMKNYQMRLQTSGSKKNGYPEFATPQGTSTAVLTHLVFTRRADGQERFYINGSEAARGIRKGGFGAWTTAYEFVLANEQTNDRPWLGEFHLVAVYDRSLTPEEVAQNFAAGASAATSVAPPRALKTVYRDDFSGGTGKWKQGKISADGVKGTPALSVTRKGSDLWEEFGATVRPTTTIRIKVKPLGPVERAEIQLWCESLKENGRYHIDRLPGGKWTTVEFRATEVRMKWDRSGPPFPVGEKLANFKISFTAGEDVEVLLDDLEILD